MNQIDPVITLKQLTSNLFWGVVKSEKRITGRTTIYSKMVSENMAILLFKCLEQFGITVPPAKTAIEAIETFIAVAIENGIFLPEAIEILKNNNELHITIKTCPFSCGCTKLINEGIVNFSCPQRAIISVATQKFAEHFTEKTTIQPGNCVLHFTES